MHGTIFGSMETTAELVRRQSNSGVWASWGRDGRGMEHGAWSMEHGAWSMEHGAVKRWSVGALERGGMVAWSREHGVVGDQDSDPENEICYSPIALLLAKIRRRLRDRCGPRLPASTSPAEKGSEGLEGARPAGVT